MDVAELYRRTVETWTARVRAVAAGPVGRARPRAREWTVRDLVTTWSARTPGPCR